VTTAAREAPHHNTLTCVKHYDCRLPECVERHRAYQRERYHSRTAGTWQPLVDAEPIRQHILELQAANFTPVRISELANIPFQTVVGFIRVHGYNGQRRGRKRRCTREVAARILAITPDTAKPGHVDAAGTVRRLQALVAAGWPMEHLGSRISPSCHSVRTLIRQQRCYGRTADAVARVFEELKNEKPEKAGVDRRSASRSRSYAKRRNWPTVTYWADRMDVIDDPDFEPLYGVTRREIVAQDANELMRVSGLDRAAVAERLGVTKSYIDHAFRDHPEYALETAA
jgi:hypothetical protein